MESLKDLLSKRDKNIIYFSKTGCPYCIMFEEIWNSIEKLSDNDVIWSRENNKIDDIGIVNINVDPSQKDEINNFWKLWAKNRIDLTHLLPKYFGGEEIKRVQERTWDKGLFNGDHPNEYCRRGFPTILFVNRDKYAFFPSQVLTRSVPAIMDIASLMFNDGDFSNIDITKRNGKYEDAELLYINSNAIHCNKKLLNIIENDNYMYDSIEGLCIMNFKIDALKDEIRRKIYVVGKGDLDRSDLPVPSIYSLKDKIFYVYNDALQILNDFIALQ